MKKCKHDYEIGNIVWKGKIPKIEAECIYCKKKIIFDFEKSLGIFSEENKK